jgi:hypothetical protein
MTNPWTSPAGLLTKFWGDASSDVPVPLHGYAFEWKHTNRKNLFALRPLLFVNVLITRIILSRNFNFLHNETVNLLSNHTVSEIHCCLTTPKLTESMIHHLKFTGMWGHDFSSSCTELFGNKRPACVPADFKIAALLA